MKKFLAFLCFVIFMNFTTSLSCYAEMVMFNTKTYKYHSLNCKWAKKCTVNCVKIEKKIAIKRGGIPCKVCGG